MKRHMTLLSACALTAFASGAANADCAADLAALEAGHGDHQGIAKDGTLAPLQNPDDATKAGETDAAADADPTAAGDGLAKDGSVAPLEQAQGDHADQAMSGQDAQAQQEGEPTAAEAADGAAPSDGDAHGAALEKARAALAAGDEDACRAALDEAKTM